ncbi:hypothetical protein FOA43_000506 [Brettanomyces nanus]|uniref:Aspartate aminotransferase n=1 Tax=Eeniella nana TaxID=13502 RepID=A0A875RZX4_EENNA|nr:uncharacterized protein FOA43_000506 [Brettanomyces nanus]QPG73199.1 hypothetical protein FOA43_000506 [Brettanomyces nanus]
MFRSSKSVRYIRFPSTYSLASNLVRFQSRWAGVPQAPSDKILGLSLLYTLDANPNKVDLGVGAYRDGNGSPWILPSVRMAEKILQDTESDKEYSPILGSPKFIQLVQKLLFAHDTSGFQLLADGRIVTAQGLSGTGSLRVLAEFLHRFHSNHHVKVPDPTWTNHLSIMKDSGLTTSAYRYYDQKSNALDFDGLLEDLSRSEEGTIVLLHLSCHNPTGVDSSPEQWDEIIKMLSERNLVPVVDTAYQGFQSGDPVKDLATLFKFNDAVAMGKIPTYLLSQSFAKNMGLYGERVGTLSVICSGPRESERVRSQLAKLIRPMYSSPPTHGSKLVETILGNEDIYNQWLNDVKTMCDRLDSMRLLLYDKLTVEYNSALDWEHIITQKGMFCYTGLNPRQVEKLRSTKSVYMTADGRISIAGICLKNIDYLARSIDEVTKETA